MDPWAVTKKSFIILVVWLWLSGSLPNGHLSQVSHRPGRELFTLPWCWEILISDWGSPQGISNCIRYSYQIEGAHKVSAIVSDTDIRLREPTRYQQLHQEEWCSCYKFLWSGSTVDSQGMGRVASWKHYYEYQYNWALLRFPSVKIMLPGKLTICVLLTQFTTYELSVDRSLLSALYLLVMST